MSTIWSTKIDVCEKNQELIKNFLESFFLGKKMVFFASVFQPGQFYFSDEMYKSTKELSVENCNEEDSILIITITFKEQNDALVIKLKPGEKIFSSCDQVILTSKKNTYYNRFIRQESFEHGTR